MCVRVLPNQCLLFYCVVDASSYCAAAARLYSAVPHRHNRRRPGPIPKAVSCLIVSYRFEAVAATTEGYRMEETGALSLLYVNCWCACAASATRFEEPPLARKREVRLLPWMSLQPNGWSVRSLRWRSMVQIVPPNTHSLFLFSLSKSLYWAKNSRWWYIQWQPYRGRQRSCDLNKYWRHAGICLQELWITKL